MIEGKVGFPVKSFYSGATKKEYFRQQKKRLNDRERKLNSAVQYTSRKLAKRYSACFTERVVWRYFPRQQFAVEFCDDKREPCLRLFTYEKANGKRKFLVTTQRQFWERYKVLADSQRHYYEVIRLQDPCRLYFDIEYYREFNPDKNEAETLVIFVEYVFHCIQTKYDIHCTRENVVDLDSSTDLKFSRHLIFHLNQDEILFRNNHECGEFVKEICSCLELFLENNVHNRYLPCGDVEKQVFLSRASLQQIFVKTEQGSALLCDLSVYSKNRNFRLYLSSKVSKHVPLKVAKDNQFIFKKSLNRLERQLYTIRNEKFDPAFQKFQDTLVCPRFVIPKIKQLLNSKGKEDIVGEASMDKMLAEKDRASKCYPKHSKEGSASTCYPTLDRFVLSHVNERGSRGIIRRWLLYDQSQLLIYLIEGNKWCGNIQREHKSNHVYYIADLKFQNLYQKCFDPDCMHYRSPEIHIPDNVNPFSDKNITIDDFDISIDKELDNFFEEDFDFENDDKESGCNDSVDKTNRLVDETADYFNDDFEIFENDDAVINTSITATEKCVVAENDLSYNPGSNIKVKNNSNEITEAFIIPGCSNLHNGMNNPVDYIEQEIVELLGEDFDIDVCEINDRSLSPVLF